MKRSIGLRTFRAACVLLAPAAILMMIVWGWLGMVWAELRGE